MAGPTTTFQTGVHGSRPAASAGCVLYSCTTHSLVYRSDGSTWTTFVTLPAGSSSASPSLTFGTSASAGAAATFVATDATIPIFDATAPTTQAFGDSATVGTAAFAARRDHKHGMPSSSSVTTQTADASADVSLSADTPADATSVSLSLVAGTYIILGVATLSCAGATTYGICYVTDNSNNVIAEGRATVANNSPETIHAAPLVLVVGSTTTYKIRGQMGTTTTAKILRYSESPNIGTRLVAARIA